jgi:hypothetical protein
VRESLSTRLVTERAPRCAGTGVCATCVETCHAGHKLVLPQPPTHDGHEHSDLCGDECDGIGSLVIGREALPRALAST